MWRTVHQTVTIMNLKVPAWHSVIVDTVYHLGSNILPVNTTRLGHCIFQIAKVQLMYFKVFLQRLILTILSLLIFALNKKNYKSTYYCGVNVYFGLAFWILVGPSKCSVLNKIYSTHLNFLRISLFFLFVCFVFNFCILLLSTYVFLIDSD